MVKEATLPADFGTALAAMRRGQEVTQATLADKAGMDQSRVSRIEKDGAATIADADKLLRTLGEMGSDAATDYLAYLHSDWVQVERPEFSNPQRGVLAMAEEALSQIEEFAGNEDRPWPLKRQLERQRSAIRYSASYLRQTAHQIAFIGEVGVGKSTAISFLYALLEPAAPDGKRMERVVLETGGGHTTLCEVNVRRGPSHGIVVQAQSEPEMRNLIADFCASTWHRRPGTEGEKGEKVGVSEEVQRALRNMSGLTVKRDKGPDGRNLYRDQATELAQECSSEEEFRARVMERVRLDSRTRREIWVEDSKSRGAMQQLRAIFRDVNNGRLHDVPMPASIDIIIPDFGGDIAGLTVSVVDTKGMDEITVRADLDARLKDPRTHVVLCSTFNQAPSTSTQLLLEHLRNAHGVPLDAGKVSILALPRPGEALGVKDDVGESAIDDEDGYNLKREQILRHLGSGEEGTMSGVPIFFFNAHDDQPQMVRSEIHGQVLRLRQTFEERLLGECAAADEVIQNHEKQAFTMAVQEVTNRLATFLDAHRPLPSRVRPAHQEMTNALAEVRYASTIWAMTRRNGEYYNFSVSHHVGAGGAKDAMLRSKNWFERLQGLLDTLKKDPDLSLASKTILQIEASTGVWRRKFAEASRAAAVEVFREPLESDQKLWYDCVTQWGAGPGFKARVSRLLADWFEKRTDLNDQLEEIMAAAWDQQVLRQLERLSHEGDPSASSQQVTTFGKLASG
jgi:transcriptional regulator with XRE-family HTH domain